ncbi:unnamed protein product [Diatraea saccharalis]|uniref:ZAD domain-containing protein n=1 Tax=Diatraea saccharalis TaxID=40085 RepID=A0A9N9R713_9NEOP|nr:unnamed protein product [Diatraea saccharalis]
MGAPFMELEKPLDDIAMLCRGCLADSGEMKDMYEWGLADGFCKLTDVQMESTEPISRLLCINCEDTLAKCISFKRQCGQSDALLRKLAKKTADTQSNALQTEGNTISYALYDDHLTVMITSEDTQAKIYLPCPYQCKNKFQKKHDLLAHLIKSHNVNENKFKIDSQYYCKETECSYHISSGSKWFSGRKFLNQHYRKVHNRKIFTCPVCNLKFSSGSDYNRHLKTCNMTFSCTACNAKYNCSEKLTVHLMRKHPELHKRFKEERKANKRKAKQESETKKAKTNSEKLAEFICDSPKRTSATQTLNIEECIKNDFPLVPWNSIPGKNDSNESKKDEISTQTVFEDLLSIKSQTSEDESIFFSETVSLSDIQTQTFPLEFGLSRSNKETITSETQSPSLSIKETQTCFCLYDSPKPNYRLFDSISSSPCSINLTSTETQTAEMKSNIKSDVLLSFNSAETQTHFTDDIDNDI